MLVSAACGPIWVADSCAMAVYRVNTFPFIHLNFVHAILNILALTPLLERFESEYGTLTSVALFFGRKSWTPGPARGTPAEEV